MNPPPEHPIRTYSDSYAYSPHSFFIGNSESAIASDNDDTAENLEPQTAWSWWPSESPCYLLGHLRANLTETSPFISTPSLAAFDTPLSDAILLRRAASSYNVSPHLWPREFSTRSMSASATNAAQPSTTHNNSAPNLPPPRQIRFVSSDGQPHTKRRRINAACLTCRKRKTRCSGERPQCKTCTDNSHACAGYVDRTLSNKEDGTHEEQDAEDDQVVPSLHRRGMGREEVPKLIKRTSHDSPDSPNSRTKYDSDHLASPGSVLTTNSSMASARTRVPYFRYFGPTAIVPGFKQMVVQLKDHRRSWQAAFADSPSSGTQHETVSSTGIERMLVEIPFYDAADPGPNAPLITHLCELFFTHLGCNYPFLPRKRFLKDLEEKRVDAILVDAVCAVAARFSQSPCLMKSADPSVPLDSDNNVRRAFRGHPFAQRAMSAVIDTFPCPTIAVAQACLLLAYEEFGTDHDSGLWMYLGTSIRMAQDLGIQKLQGLHLEGRIGPTPKSAKHGSEGKDEEKKRGQEQKALSQHLLANSNTKQMEDRRASESERIDTFWAIFFLDRAVSSGVGRPVTLRDKDIEISFPYRPDETVVNGYPHPFPPLIRIVHMYGRVADVLNNIKDVSQVTPEVLKRLASMEKDLTGIYQRLSPRLHFNAINFQHYVKAGQGTNFILLHFWFHTLIVLLHQPTLLHSFEGRIQQLFPDSRELAISSAKTIADILAFAELIDVKSFIGNPFTSQPMYVAACAFLAEAAAHTSQPPSRGPTPSQRSGGHKSGREDLLQTTSSKQTAASAKHTLLATAANQNYQRCYKALQVLNSYWAGCRYILTALDQKSKGLMDPLLYTSDDIDGEMPSTEPSFTTPGWRGSSVIPSSGAALSALRSLRAVPGSNPVAVLSPKMEWGQAIGWSLSGTTNSPAPNLSLFYPSNSGNIEHKYSMTVDAGRLPEVENDRNLQQPGQSSTCQNSQHQRQGQPRNFAAPGSMMPPPQRRISSLPYDPVSTAEADLLLGLHSPFNSNSASPQIIPSLLAPPLGSGPTSFGYPQRHPNLQSMATDPQSAFVTPSEMDFNDMFIESQDIDMSGQSGIFTFPGGDMLPWLEYLPQDVLNYFGDPNMDADIGRPPTSGPAPDPSGGDR